MARARVARRAPVHQVPVAGAGAQGPVPARRWVPGRRRVRGARRGRRPGAGGAGGGPGAGGPGTGVAAVPPAALPPLRFARRSGTSTSSSTSTASTDEAKATLDELAQALKANPQFVVTIEGHADERGTVEYNLALGEQRAQAAKAYLVAARHRREPRGHHLLR